VSADIAGDPWLSVITVVRNDPEGFQLTLNSLQRQNLTGIELIVIDGSDDTTEIPAIVGTGPEINVKYQWDTPRGIYSAMNTGIEIATGEYVLFANAGDTFFADSVLASIRARVHGVQPTWIVGRVCINESGGKTVTTGRLDYEAEKRRLFARGDFPPHQATLVRTRDLKGLGGFCERFSISADYHAALKLSRMSSPLILDEVVMTFREGGVSTKQWRESFKEFHQARLDVFAPHGTAKWLELLDTYWHFSTVWLYRSVISQLSRRKSDLA
jgi:glycosyltransferase involved in cell wall biosynthesis